MEILCLNFIVDVHLLRAKPPGAFWGHRRAPGRHIDGEVLFGEMSLTSPWCLNWEIIQRRLPRS